MRRLKLGIRQFFLIFIFFAHLSMPSKKLSVRWISNKGKTLIPEALDLIYFRVKTSSTPQSRIVCPNTSMRYYQVTDGQTINFSDLWLATSNEVILELEFRAAASTIPWSSYGIFYNTLTLPGYYIITLPMELNKNLTTSSYQYSAYSQANQPSNKSLKGSSFQNLKASMFSPQYYMATYQIYVELSEDNLNEYQYHIDSDNQCYLKEVSPQFVKLIIGIVAFFVVIQ